MSTTSTEQAKPYSELITVTPDLAQQMLAKMAPNRQLRQPVVEAYKRDFLAGKWLIAESIKLDREGRLIDGHHRLQMCVQLDQPFETFVTYNLDPRAMEVIDTNAVRKTADVLKMSGHLNTTTLAATLRIGVLIENGLLTDTGGLKTGGGQYRQTHNEELDFLQRNPDLVEAVNGFTQAARKVKMATSSYTYGAWVLRRVDEAAFQEFSDAMVQKATEGIGDPRLTLLDYCDQMQRQALRMGVGEALYLLFTAWNTWRDGKTLRKLTPFIGENPRPIPEPR